MKKQIFYSFVDVIINIPTVVLYFFLFLSLIALEYYNFNLNPDLSIQLNSLVNFVEGHGITIAGINDNHLVYTSFSQWPAGLVFFLLPIYLITKSTIASVLILNTLCYFLYIVFLNKSFQYLNLNKLKQKIIILFLTISVAPFIHFYPSDTLATVICLWGFYFNIQFLDSKKNWQLILSIFLLCLSYFIKYSFLPFVFYPLISFLLKERDNLFKIYKKCVLILLFTLTLLILVYLLNLSLVGDKENNLATHFDLFTGKAHWNQLSHFDGFLFTFGIYEWVFENFLKNHFTLNIQFNWISIIVTCYFYFLIIKTFFKSPKKIPIPFSNFLNTFLVSSFLIITFLVFLSLNNPGQTWMKPYWTFVQESRYYGPVIVMGLIIVLLIFLNEKQGKLIHILVPLIIVFNVYAWRTVKSSGFWGNNYESYVKNKKELNERIKYCIGNEGAIFFYEPNMKYSMPFLILLSEGKILLNNNLELNKNQFKKNCKFILLKNDPPNTYQLAVIE